MPRLRAWASSKHEGGCRIPRSMDQDCIRFKTLVSCGKASVALDYHLEDSRSHIVGTWPSSNPKAEKAGKQHKSSYIHVPFSFGVYRNIEVLLKSLLRIHESYFLCVL